MLTLSSLLQISHIMLRQHCKEGDTVLDATMGNGKDTVFLAGLVGKSGLVVAMDRQQEALDTTKSLLDVMDLSERCNLVLAEHRDMADALYDAMGHEKFSRGLAAAVFNLGYLPGGNKNVTTDGKSTIMALDAVWPSIRPGGMLSVHTYTGHPGAEEELDMVNHWMKNVLWREAQVSACSQHNKPENPETLFLAVKKNQ